MSDDSLSPRVLIEIRDEIRQTNARLDRLAERVEDGFEQTNERIDLVRTELKDEIREVDLRAQTRMVELVSAAVRTNEMLQDRFDLRDRIENCEREIDELKKRVG